MDEIPEDIQQTATRFAGEYLARDISCERLYRDVAALLVAERERCANIVEGIGDVGRDWALTSFMGNLRRDIAAAIRRS
ncbi:hypothetical protein EFV37_29080 [Mesorhizobium loti]|uniref:Uncharacterized protein n=1 Tax=Mesorhizobium jarvisii TaxID=1777867 RepID=A0A6M7TRU3_9HYPH|nr:MULTISPECIES: hypothetical protein [Mesorhizobium]OBQ68892.1 hypothetical protein A9K72_11930 [Mesorhizobium loti]QKC65857.1 hypothetical protein EB229_29070 [Mesorhizobium jarvisii]QKD11771.1 hypothetical protein EFV37_29080 [Mesorhizobium loti]RJT37877.1 hypothetical protein D3242_01125 [Mesorhizobium jarvisii]